MSFNVDGLTKYEFSDDIFYEDGVQYCKTQIENYGQRYIDYRKSFYRKSADGPDLPFPIYILFEQTYRCNLRCPICIHSRDDLKTKYDTHQDLMPISLYKTVILECEKHACPSIAMHNCDEPLLVPDIAERIRFAKDHGVMDIFLTTNGQLLTETKAARICEAGLTHVSFSIDAATKETYEKNRINAKFEKVLSAIGFIKGWKRKNASKLPIIRASFARNINNYFEEEDFIEKFKDIVDLLDIQAFIVVDDFNRGLAAPCDQPLDPSEFECSEPFHTVVVRADGSVSPCCEIHGYKQIVGNLYHSSLFKIFNNEKMKQLRSELKEKNYNLNCMKCSTSRYKKSQAELNHL